MNIIKTIAVIGLCALAVSARAELGHSQYTSGNQAYGGTNYAVITENTSIGGNTGAEPVVNYLNATGTNALGVLSILVPTNAVIPITITNFGVTNIVSYTNGLVTGQFLLFEHLGTPKSYELGVLASINPTPWTTNANTPGQTNYTWSINTATATAATYYAGDAIYPLGWYKGKIVVGNTTISLTGPGLFSGERRKPLVIVGFDTTVAIGTNCSTINAVNATYAP